SSPPPAHSPASSSSASASAPDGGTYHSHPRSTPPASCSYSPSVQADTSATRTRPSVASSTGTLERAIPAHQVRRYRARISRGSARADMRVEDCGRVGAICAAATGSWPVTERGYAALPHSPVGSGDAVVAGGEEDHGFVDTDSGVTGRGRREYRARSSA